MKKIPTNSEPERRPAISDEPVRKSVLILTSIIGLGAVIAVVVASKFGKPGNHTDTSPAEDGQALQSSGAGALASDRVSFNSRSAGIFSRPASLNLPTPSQPGPSDNARQLVKSLSEVNTRQGELTSEKAEKWQRSLEELVEQGTAAVPVLQEFFQKNVDVRFDSGPETNLLGEPSLRMAFIEVLFNIPAPQNVDLEEEILRATTDPGEVALLARQLELQEPGKYREAIVQTVQSTLRKAKDGGLPDRDTTPLIKILEQYGVTEMK